MSFAFGFADDDIDDPSVPEQVQTNPLDAADGSHVPELVSFERILTSLKDVRITFDNYTTPKGNIVYRRELFDVKHQVMSEDTVTSMGSILLGDEKDVDLKQNVYEGGFKSWECSYDAVDHVAVTMDLLLPQSMLELGCGTALPTCFVLRRYLEEMSSQKDTAVKPSCFVLTDFNYDVLRLVTVPNLVVHWASTIPPQRLHMLCSGEDGPPLQNDEIIITQQLISAIIADFASKKITVSLVSGGWNRRFLNIAKSFGIETLITSETIYSPQSLPLVAELILGLMSSEPICSRAVVAAKSIYFGVGGSVTEFVNYLETRRPQHIQLLRTEVGESQLKRVIIDISS